MRLKTLWYIQLHSFSFVLKLLLVIFLTVLIVAVVMTDYTYTRIDCYTCVKPGKRISNQRALLELGCGVGNSVFPLLKSNVGLFIVAIDMSRTAITILKVRRLDDDGFIFGSGIRSLL